MLKNMRYVYAVYTYKSFSKAAEALYISQPALSSTIKKVEETIGLPIFDRSNNPIKLTPAGQHYINTIENIMRLEKEMRSYFDQLKEQNQNTINIGGTSFFCTYVLPKLVQQFNMKYSNYTVNLTEGNTDLLIKYLREGDVDLIIDVENKPESKLFNSIVWSREDLLLAVPSHLKVNEELKENSLTFQDITDGTYKKKKYSNISLKFFENETFILLKKGHDMHERSLKICNNAGFTPKVSMYLDQLLTSYEIANKGIGITFIRASITRYLSSTDKLYFYKIDDALAFQNIMLYYKQSYKPSNSQEQFISFIKNAINHY